MRGEGGKIPSSLQESRPSPKGDLRTRELELKMGEP